MAAKKAPVYADMTLERAREVQQSDPAIVDLLEQLQRRTSSIRSSHERFRDWCTRADGLYYAETFTAGGADLWPNDPSVSTPGRTHVSVNTAHVYVDVPAALQAVDPIENMLATDTTPEARDAAADYERVYVAWKGSQGYDLKFHKATVVKSLYGMTASRVYWDPNADSGAGAPAIEVIEQPRNLWLGYKTDEYNELEWAAYVLRYEPNALTEQFGLQLDYFVTADGLTTPVVNTFGNLPGAIQFQGNSDTGSPREWLNFGDARIEVWDYWYRKPKFGRNGKFQKMVTCNAVIAAGTVIQGPTEYPEYEGVLPYVPLFNTFVPGVPTGRAELHDVEHLIREKMEKITAGSQMISNGVAGDYWQLVGPDAPTRVPASLKPKRNTLVGPGPGNRIETITPFIAQFQLEQFLTRLDRETATVSGLNDLLLGLAPAQVLSSSKAINALIANYESRLSMRRQLLYKWRKDTWELAANVWSHKSDIVRSIREAGGGILDITDPSLSPRDEMETSTRALNLTNGKLMSQHRAMDLIGIDDPETELDLIREESTDATLWPERVQVMAQLMGALQALGLNAPPPAAGMAGAQAASGNADLQAALGAQTPQNATSSQLPGDQGIQPPVPGEALPPFAAAEQAPVMEGMLMNGEAKGRIMTKQKLGRR